MMEQNEKVRGNETDGHDGPDPLNSLTLQASPDVDGRQGEADVGKHECPPVQVEPILATGGDAANDADAEEPER